MLLAITFAILPIQQMLFLVKQLSFGGGGGKLIQIFDHIDVEQWQFLIKT